MIFMFTKNAGTEIRYLCQEYRGDSILRYGTGNNIFCVGKYTKRRKIPRKGVGTTYYGELAIR